MRRWMLHGNASRKGYPERASLKPLARLEAEDQVLSRKPCSRSSSSSIMQLVLRGFSNKCLIKRLLGIKSKGGKSIGVSLKLKIGVSSKVFTVSTLLAIGV